MKEIFNFKIAIIILSLLFVPIVVNATITCNDGTPSPTCEDCHTGCCSRHGGCTDNPNNNSNSYNYEDEDKTTDNYEEYSVDDDWDKTTKKETNDDDNTIRNILTLLSIAGVSFAIGKVYK